MELVTPLRLKEVIVVEGKYDERRVKALFDTQVFVTEGFAIRHNPQLLSLLGKLSLSRGVILLTDSDASGRSIRTFLRDRLPGRVLEAYIPDIYGKERRKRAPSAEGKLGVEGVPDEVIIEAVKRSGAVFPGEGEALAPSGPPVTRTELFEAGFFGGAESAGKRIRLLHSLGLPERMNVTSLLEILNSSLGRDEYEKAKKSIEEAAASSEQKEKIVQ